MIVCVLSQVLLRLLLMLGAGHISVVVNGAGGMR